MGPKNKIAQRSHQRQPTYRLPFFLPFHCNPRRRNSSLTDGNHFERDHVLNCILLFAAAQPIQTASADFFGPIALAYLAVCLTWLLVRYLCDEDRWPHEDDVTTDRPWLDGLMVLAAGVGVFAIGTAYRRNWLLPGSTDIVSAINLCIPYLPIFVVLAIRRQSIATVWLTSRALKWKLTTGLLAAIVGLLVFLAMRGEWARLPQIPGELASRRSWVHAPAVFLEALAVAFIFVRLHWLVRKQWIAVLVPCLLFAAAHISSGVASGRSTWEIIAFFVFNSALAAGIFSVVMHSRDVIWIAIPHFVLDIAIGAFG